MKVIDRLLQKLSRMLASEWYQESDAAKAEFRREDDELVRAGRGHEVLRRNLEALGIRDGKRTRLVSVNGVRFRA